MKYAVYVIKNPDNKLYIGQTSNLKRRITSHNVGKPNYTSRFSGPWRLVYTEVFETRTEAMWREKQLKKQKGGDVLKKIIGNKDNQ